MPKKTFIRKKEDFICERCGASVKGTGYTNHCPKCLWSKHVDIFPGDRKSTCQGMMKPVGMDLEKGGYIITHRCVKCGYEKRNAAAPGDDFEEILKLVKKKPKK